MENKQLFFIDDRMIKSLGVATTTPNNKIFFEFVFEDPSLNLISSEYNCAVTDSEQFRINLMIDVAKQEFDLNPIYL
jgi:hypothetical protein